MKETEDIKNRIDGELKKANPDFALVAELSDFLADAAQDRMRFSVEASHINRLGLELVAKRETALSELIKNSYDADATEVSVLLEDYSKPHGNLTIEDNGCGMSRDVIRTAWMTLSTSSKSDADSSPKFKRPRAGRKGIGRFATQRLGERLVLETTVAGSPLGHRVIFDWDQDFVQGRKLSSIWTEIEEYDCPVEKQGTTLRIINLRDAWTDASLDQVWKSILFLQPPFPLTIPASSLSGKSSDPGFRVQLNGSDEKGMQVSASLEENLLQYALAEIKGYIDETGAATFEYKSTRLGTSDKFKSKKTYALTGPVSLEARYFIFAAKSVPGISASAAKRFGDLFGGIRIHRNSFRVLPYGETSNDWLRLDRDTARRNILPPGNNSNFFGYVSISEEDNPELEETSSREGLVENDAFLELTHFARSCLEWAILRIAADRKRKQSATQKDYSPEIPKPSMILETGFTELEDTLLDLDETFTSDEAKEKFRIALEDMRRSASAAAVAYESRYEEDRERSIEYESMLRILASLGLSISVFGHEIKSATNMSSGTFALLKIQLDQLSDEKQRETLIETSGRLEDAIARVFGLGGYIEDLTSSTGTRKLKPVPVQGAIDRFTEQFSSYLDKYGVIFDVNVFPKSLRTCPMHTSEFDSILFNLLTNSVKAFQRAGTKDPKIKIEATASDGVVKIKFEDNGHAIPKADRARIFDAFFTTSEFSDDEVSGPGTGLGLTIISDIANTYGGSVVLAEADPGFITSFLVTLNAR